MDPSGTKKYTEEDEDGAAGASAAAATAAAKVAIGKKTNRLLSGSFHFGNFVFSCLVTLVA